MASGSLVPKHPPQSLHLPNGTKPALDISKHPQELNVDPNYGQKRETVSAREQPAQQLSRNLKMNQTYT